MLLIQAIQAYHPPLIAKVITWCRALSRPRIPLASHDDATRVQVSESAAYRMTVAEFPTTVETAKESHEPGLRVMMGAPNIVRSGSHSGNMAAADLVRSGVLDIMSSDYYPSSLLDAAFMLADQDNDYSFVLTHYHMDRVLGLFHLRWGAGAALSVLEPEHSMDCANNWKMVESLVNTVKPERTILTHSSHEMDCWLMENALPANVIAERDNMLVSGTDIEYCNHHPEIQDA